MALALDGTPGHASAGSGSTIGVTTITSASDVLVCAQILVNGKTVSSISSANTGTWTLRATNGAASPIELWSAVAASPINETVTVTFTGSSFHTVDTWGISGADTTIRWDANAALPDTGLDDPRSISTDTADTFCIGSFRMAGTANPTEGSGWTKISGANFLLAEYKIVSATQSGLSVTIGTGVGDANGGIGDAVIIAAAGGIVPLRMMMGLGT